MNCPISLTHMQSEDIEESTGIVYPHQDKHRVIGPQHDPSDLSVKEGNTPRDLIKSGFTQIHVSYDRIEPETGESENVAVVDVNGATTRGGRGAEPVAMEEGEVVSGEEGGEGTPVQQESIVPTKMVMEGDDRDVNKR